VKVKDNGKSLIGSAGNDSFETTDKREVRGRRGEVRRKSGARKDEVFFSAFSSLRLCASAVNQGRQLILSEFRSYPWSSVFIRGQHFLNCMVPAQGK
jgi:hypothetical protein